MEIKKYVRTKSGRILDKDKILLGSKNIYYYVKTTTCDAESIEIVATSNDPKDLIQVGDLLLFKTKTPFIVGEEDIKNGLRNLKLWYFLNEIYTKIDNDYILQWRKENE